MKLIKRDGSILLTADKIDNYVTQFNNVSKDFKRVERDYFLIDLKSSYNDVDRMSKWSVMSTVIHKIDTSIRRYDQ